MTLSGDLPGKRGAPQPDGSIEGCKCTSCQDARKRPCEEQFKMVECVDCGQLMAIPQSKASGRCAHCSYLLAKETAG